MPEGTRAKNPTNSDIMKAIGELTADMKTVRREIDNDAANRKSIYEKMEEQGREVAKMGVRVETAVAEVAEVKRGFGKLYEDLAPLVNSKEDITEMTTGWKDLNRTGKRLVWLLSIGGVSILSAVIWFGDLVAKAVRGWLGIS